jgi:hypothetical protein
LAADALLNTIDSKIREPFVEQFFTCQSAYGVFTCKYGESHMLRWISRMTDILSGVVPELPDEEIPLNARSWFRALVKQESG